eukprot:scaffold58397_cov35-Phaeocystis_antarctica.AAC.1
MAVLVNAAAGALHPRVKVWVRGRLRVRSIVPVRQTIASACQITLRGSGDHTAPSCATRTPLACQITLPPLRPHTHAPPLPRTCAAQALLEFAKGTPCVLAGDFNQVPDVRVRIS